MSTFIDTSVLIDHTRGLQAAHDALTQAAGLGWLHSSETVRTDLLVLIGDLGPRLDGASRDRTGDLLLAKQAQSDFV